MTEEIKDSTSTSPVASTTGTKKWQSWLLIIAAVGVIAGTVVIQRHAKAENVPQIEPVAS